MKPRLLPSVECLRGAFSYDAKTGVLSRRIDGGLREIQTKNAFGYLVVQFMGRQWKQHRVIWKIHTGQEPPDIIDHVDMNPANNIWDNLRESDTRRNSWGAKQRIHNTSGQRGVVFHRRSGKWRASIQNAKKRDWLGTFDSFDDAKAAYNAASAKIIADLGLNEGEAA